MQARKQPALITLLGLCAAVGAAHAQSVAALMKGDTLAIVDVAAKKIQKTVKVSGLSGALLGIDVRPADGMLYGLVADGTIVTIDPATRKVATTVAIKGAGPVLGIDVRPG